MSQPKPAHSYRFRSFRTVSRKMLQRYILHLYTVARHSLQLETPLPTTCETLALIAHRYGFTVEECHWMLVQAQIDLG